MPKRRRGRPRKRFKGGKLSVMVIHRIKDTMELTSSIEAYKQSLAAALAARYAPHLREGEALPDFAFALDLKARDVKAALGRLIRVDDAVDDKTVEHRHLRLEREDLVADLYPRAVAVRGSIDLAFGRERGRRLHGLRGRTQRKAPGLERQLRRLLFRLRDRRRAWPAPRNLHAPVDREGWIGDLKPGFKALVKTGRAVGLLGKALEGLTIDRRHAIQDFDLAYGHALRHVRADFVAAGFDARMLKNLRPYYRRRFLAKKARKAREARAAASATAAAEAAWTRDDAETELPADETARVTVSATVARWLEKSRLFGT